MQTEKNLTQRQAELSATKQALLLKRLKQPGLLTDLSGPANAIGPRPAAASLPLSFAQQRLWFLQQLEPDSSAYNEALATRLSGPLNLDAFNQASREFLRRHEVMRSRFFLLDGQVSQVLDPDYHETFVTPYEDMSSLSEDAVLRRAEAELRRPFDLAHELPWRTFLWQLGEQEFFSLTILHHLITDGWSLAVFYREMGRLYAAFSANQPSPLPDPHLHYGDYAFWQHQWLSSPQASAQLLYWQEQLGSPLPVLDLPLDHPRPATAHYRGQRLPVNLEAHLCQQLRQLGQQSGATLFMVLLTGFLILLHRYSQQEDLLVGTPIAGRTRPELENLLGCFVNTLVLRTHLDGQPTIQELLQQVREVTLQAYDHQDIPFDKLVEVLQPERTLNRNPLFQVMFVLQNTPLSQVSLRDLLMTPVELHNVTAKFDLELTLSETEQGITGYFEYCTDLFETATLEQMREHFMQILDAIVADPVKRINELPLLSPAETRQLLETWNDTRTIFPDERCFPAYVAAQAEHTPANLALSDQHEQVSYRELQARAAQVAAQLQSHGVKPETPVGLYTGRSVSWGIAVLALFQAGGVYLPLDPQYPPARTRSILEQSGCCLLLTTRDLVEQARELFAGQVLCLEDLEQAPCADRQAPQLAPGNLAYVIYTSGSTGRPKGAMLEHRGMLNHLYSKVAALNLREQDIVAQTASQCFDISVWQLCAAWLVGAHVHIYAHEVVQDPQMLLEQIQRDRVSILEVVPSLLRSFLAWRENATFKPELPHLRWLIPTGEALTLEIVQPWLQLYPHVPLLNAYGPSECSDDVTHQVIDQLFRAEQVGARVPIGRPLPNLRIYVLDQRMQPLPRGVHGEIYVGGVGVGRGYLGDPARTALQFVPDPWSQVEGGRLYRTGDRGYYRPDGSLVFVGRTDEQVKIRGYRVEPGEIEAVLREQSGVSDCAVICRQSAGTPRLLAYVVCRQEMQLAKETLQRDLHATLPEYMVPTIVLVDALPRTVNGKLDRRALPDYKEEADTVQVGYVAPRNPMEEQLAAIWADVLSLTRVGVHDNFFDIGGHSLLITQILARTSDIFQVTLPVRTLFKNPTIAGLAEAIEKTRSRGSELRKQAVTSVSREAFRQKRSTLSEAVQNSQGHLKG